MGEGQNAEKVPREMIVAIGNGKLVHKISLCNDGELAVLLASPSRGRKLEVNLYLCTPGRRRRFT